MRRVVRRRIMLTRRDQFHRAALSGTRPVIEEPLGDRAGLCSDAEVSLAIPPAVGSIGMTMHGAVAAAQAMKADRVRPVLHAPQSGRGSGFERLEVFAAGTGDEGDPGPEVAWLEAFQLVEDRNEPTLRVLPLSG